MGRRKPPLIGFDPLAWMRGDGAPEKPPRAKTVDGNPSPVPSPAPAPPLEVRMPAERVSGGPPEAIANARPIEGDTFRLSSSLTIETAREAQEALKRLGDHSPVILDARALQEIDTAGLQLLVAFVTDAARRGVKVEWREVSPALRKGAERLDLARLMGLPPTGASS